MYDNLLLVNLLNTVILSITAFSINTKTHLLSGIMEFGLNHYLSQIIFGATDFRDCSPLSFINQKQRIRCKGYGDLRSVIVFKF